MLSKSPTLLWASCHELLPLLPSPSMKCHCPNWHNPTLLHTTLPLLASPMISVVITTSETPYTRAPHLNAPLPYFPCACGGCCMLCYPMLREVMG